MAKKIKQEKRKEKEKEQTAKLPVQKATWYTDKTQLAVLAGILVLTFVIYAPSLSSSKEFTNWDDPVYVIEQPLITKLDWPHIKAIFSEPVSLNYHPITMLSLAVNYHFSQLNPFGYFLTNVFIHLCNTFLVFFFLYLLSGRNFAIGALAALLFGIHPMHVESVAWISERKDLLYCFFFLASCISYLKYIESKEVKYVLLCFGLFVMSCLSKAMAAPLPIILLLIDFYRQRKFTAATLLEKVPFFAVSLLIGYQAVVIQSHGAIADLRIFTIPERFMFASYGFVMYLIKMVAPTSLSAFYPYPVLNESGGFDWYYKISVLAALVIVLVPAFIFYKRDKQKFRLFVFGAGFFLAMLGMVLQFISVGKAIMADRYTYLPYIGAFFIIASLAAPYLENAKTKMLALGLVIIISSVLVVSSYARVQVWQDSGKLWTDVIAQFPYAYVQNGNILTVVKVGVDDAYKNRGNYYREHGDVEKAMADYELLVRVRSKDEDAYSGMGNFYAMKGQFDKSLEMYSEALKLKPGKMDTYKNRSITYSRMGKHKEALEDLESALKYNPAAEPSLLPNIAYEKLAVGLWAETIEDCNKLIAANPNDGDALLYRGTAFINLAKYQEGINDLTRASVINRSSGNIWFNLSYAYNKIGNKNEALRDALAAQKNGYQVSEQYLQELKGK